ncbi:MAG: DUF3524 domain-containing protein, partial [Thermodesulfobacteriota bacterium]|nr:DUF3524 domain-containing protein [Thermodesulfobacteriota bacterium]
MKFLFLEPFFGGSHRDFALGLKEYSSHGIDLVTLPAKFWKWRMQGAALSFSKIVKNLDIYDGIIATDMMNLSDFIALAGPAIPPVLVYFHENQFTYPLSNGEKMNYQFGITNMTTALCADKVIFNSEFHRNEFFSGVAKYTNTRPDARTAWVKDEIEKKSEVIYPGCRFSPGKNSPDLPDLSPVSPPLIVWNHRWEYDKNPEEFFKALKIIKKKGVKFRLALLGEHCSVIPKLFKEAGEFFKEEVEVFGYAESRQEYFNWLKKGAVVVSTSIQENFGISVVEAVRMGCIPLLPDRLSYPEIMPKEHVNDVIYVTFEDLVDKLETLLQQYQKFFPLKKSLSASMAKYSWEVLIREYDVVLERLA